MVKTASTSAPMGMWLAVMILAPVGMILTYLASTDSGLFDKASWKSAFKRLLLVGKK
jgi:hypothetical protein